MKTYTGTISRLFEYFKPDGDLATIEFCIDFEFVPGTARSNPGGHYIRSTGSWEPPDPPSWEMSEVTRRADDGTWISVAESDWFWNAWVVPLWDGLGIEDFEAVVMG